MKGLISRLLLSCEQASILVIKKEENKLSQTEKFQLWMHSSICGLCKEFDGQNNFINTQVQYLPSHFWPQLKELPGHLTYDGSPKELEFPDFKANYEIKCDENIFDSMGGSTATGNLDQGADIDDK